MIIKGGLVFDTDKGFGKKDILVNGTVVSDISESISIDGENIINAEGCYVLPGFIDIHTHAANGNDTMEATYEALDNMSRFNASKGVTGFLPTTVTAPLNKIVNALKNVGDTVRKGTAGSKILGVNLEGPFISKKYKGAHPEEYIISPTIKLVESLLEKSAYSIRLITIAPELDDVSEIVEHLKNYNITFSIGHSAINYSEGLKAFDNGFTHVTHLFNAMTGIHHREPGLAGAAIDHENATVELICDGVHVNPAVIRMVVKSKTSAQIAAITDSTMATGLGDGEYFLGDEKIIVKNGEARLENGVLAGSTLTMIDSLKNMVCRFNIPMEEAVRMATIAPARVIHVDNMKGSIAVGKDADITIIDSDFNVLKTIVEGTVVYTGNLPSRV